LMIFLRVLPKNFLWPHYAGAPGARGPGSLNRLNPRFLRHCSSVVGWLKVMGPPSLLSGLPSTAGSETSLDWGREYEDEDTWYELSTSYQTGPDTHLLPSKDTSLTVRMARYRRSAKDTTVAATAAMTTYRSGSSRSTMKERQDLRDLEKELEKEEDALAMFSTARSLLQRRNIMASSAANEGR